MNRFSGFSRMVSVAVVVVVLVLTGACASNGDQVAKNKAIAALDDTPASAPSDSTALIKIWRPSKLGSTTDLMIFNGPDLVMMTKGETVHQFAVPPGDLVLIFRAGNWQIIKGKVSAGMTYNILTSISQGFNAGLIRVQVVSSNDSRLQTKSLKVVSHSPQGLARFTDSAAHNYPKIVKLGKKEFAKFEAGKTTFVAINPQNGE